jgi:proteic killer suppression protein
MAIIRPCRDKRTERFLGGERVKEFQAFAEAAAKALTKLQGATILADLRSPPSNRFEALEAHKGVYSIRINRQYRVCFTWKPHAAASPGTDALQVAGDADDVEINNHYE